MVNTELPSYQHDEPSRWLKELCDQFLEEGRTFLNVKFNADYSEASFFHRLILWTPLFTLKATDGFFRLSFPSNMRVVMSRKYMVEVDEKIGCYIDLPAGVTIDGTEIRSFITQSLAFHL